MLAVPDLLAVLHFPLCIYIGFNHGCVLVFDHDDYASKFSRLNPEIRQSNVFRIMFGSKHSGLTLTCAYCDYCVVVRSTSSHSFVNQSRAFQS